MLPGLDPCPALHIQLVWTGESPCLILRGGCLYWQVLVLQHTANRPLHSGCQGCVSPQTGPGSLGYIPNMRRTDTLLAASSSSSSCCLMASLWKSSLSTRSMLGTCLYSSTHTPPSTRCAAWTSRCTSVTLSLASPPCPPQWKVSAAKTVKESPGFWSGRVEQVGCPSHTWSGLGKDCLSLPQMTTSLSSCAVLELCWVESSS